MSAEINRLGFGAWADNKIVNFLEDHGRMYALTGNGSLFVEKDDHSISSSHDPEHINIVVRAYVKDHGWKTHEWSIRRREVKP